MRHAAILTLSVLLMSFVTMSALAQEPIITDTDTLSVPEGGSASFNVKLGAEPANNVTVNVVRVRSTGDFQITTGNALTFTAGNWAEYQAVTVASGTDADSVIDSAVFRAGADGWVSASVTAWQVEAEATLTVQSTPVTGVEIGGTPSGVTDYSEVLSVDSEVTLTAPAWAGDHYFLQWLDDNGDPITSDSALNFTLIEDTTVTAEYSGAGCGTDYYVNDNTEEESFAAGDDNNSGLSPDAPMRHIQALLDRYPYIGTGCTVHVSVGSYEEHLTVDGAHSGLTLEGAGPGNSIVTAGVSGRPLTCDGFNGTVRGFTFTDGSADVGGGVYCGNDCEMTIEWCIIRDCHASGAGGGVACWSSMVDLIDCVISGNGSDGVSGGIDVYLGFVYLKNDVISGNLAALDGGGIGSWESYVVAELTTLAGNASSAAGGALYAASECEAAFEDSILSGNTAGIVGSQIALAPNVTAYVSYCDVEGGALEVYAPDESYLEWLDGNIDEDPLFVDDGSWNGEDWTNGNYHLQSTGGHWTDSGWVADLADSSCIDAGNPASAYGNEPMPNGGRVNMGAYGNTEEASKPLYYLITVQSSPITSVPIAGTPSGSTNYSSWRLPNSAVSLTAPSTRTLSGRTWYFVRWTRNGVNQSAGARTLAFSATEDTTAVAVYKRVRFLRIYGPTTVNESSSARYSCRACYSDGSHSTVTTKARWTDNSSYARFSSPGLLRTSSVSSNKRIRITAGYSGVSKSYYVTIRDVR